MNETAKTKPAANAQPPIKPSPSLDDQLKEKQDKLKSAQEDISVLQASIKALQAKIAEFQQATAGYENISSAAKDQTDKVKDKIDSQTKIATSIIGESKAKAIDKQIDNKIKEFRDAFTKQKSEVEQARSTVKTAKAAWSEADDAFRDQQAIYDLTELCSNRTIHI